MIFAILSPCMLQENIVHVLSFLSFISFSVSDAVSAFYLFPFQIKDIFLTIVASK